MADPLNSPAGDGGTATAGSGTADTAEWNANGDRVVLNDADLTLDESGLATVTDNETDTYLHGSRDGHRRHRDGVLAW